MEADSLQIPLSIAAVVDGCNDPNLRCYAIWKNSQLIVIQAPAISASHLPESALEWSLEDRDSRHNRYRDDLEHLQTLIHTIEFGKTNWGYLVHHPIRGYEVVQKQRHLYKITCHTWTRLISRREITFFQLMPFSIWNGYWRGQEVDMLDSIMWGYLALQGLDLTYSVFGHVVDDEGLIVGIAFEPQIGRSSEYRDRALVYDALSRVQQRGLVFCGASYDNIHILNGKVRLINLASIWYFPDEKAREKFANQRHWEEMDTLFSDFRNGVEIVPDSGRARMEITLLPHSSPERPLTIKSVYNLFGDEDCAKFTQNISWLKRTFHTSMGLDVLRRRERALPANGMGRLASRKSKGMSRRSFHANSALLLYDSDANSEKPDVDYATALSVAVSSDPHRKFEFRPVIDPSSGDSFSSFIETIE
ncbi:hypothetical protein DXG03_009327 [Asterophora parasitica]|uniref:Uncharacterized protein n=1 Tax=Asterophora parasitica TaxID=117018 RepID=A0A9P7G3T5_9AGAR|nr:hypothetical protein DXG03_009327 [Asterophora parasitica]